MARQLLERDTEDSNQGKIVVKPPSKNLLVGSPFTWLVAAGMFRFA